MVDRALRQIIIAVDGVLLCILNLSTLQGASVFFRICWTWLLLGCPVEIARGGSKFLHIYLRLTVLRLSQII